MSENKNNHEKGTCERENSESDSYEKDNHELAKTNSGLPGKIHIPLTVGQFERELTKRWPSTDAEKWDRAGMTVGDPDAYVKGVVVALDPTPAAVRAAAEAGANVLLTHHPAFIDPPEVFSPSFAVASSSGVTVFLAASLQVALLNYHTALDVSIEATRLFPSMLNLTFKRILAPLSDDPNKGYAILCSAKDEDIPLRVANLAARMMSVFGRPPRVWGDDTTLISRIVICNGSASSFVQSCLNTAADCLICGEIRYHTALQAVNAGLTILEIGHDVSEQPLCALLAQAAVKVGVPQDAVSIIDQSNNWHYPEAIRV